MLEGGQPGKIVRIPARSISTARIPACVCRAGFRCRRRAFCRGSTSVPGRHNCGAPWSRGETSSDSRFVGAAPCSGVVRGRVPRPVHAAAPRRAFLPRSMPPCGTCQELAKSRRSQINRRPFASTSSAATFCRNRSFIGRLWACAPPPHNRKTDHALRRPGFAATVLALAASPSSWPRWSSGWSPRA